MVWASRSAVAASNTRREEEVTSAAQILVLDPLVAFKDHAVDRRVFLDPDHQPVADRHDLDGLEQAGGENALVGIVQLGGRDGLAAGDAGIAQDGGGLDALGALDRHLVEGIALRLHRSGHKGRVDGQGRRAGKEHRFDRFHCRTFVDARSHSIFHEPIRSLPTSW